MTITGRVRQITDGSEFVDKTPRASIRIAPGEWFSIAAYDLNLGDEVIISITKKENA